MRLILHFVPFGKYSNFKVPVDNVRDWILDFVFYILDVLCISYFFSLASILTKREQKYLSERQKKMAFPYFKHTIDYNYVTVFPKMSKKVGNFALAYVSLNTINFRGNISDSVFIHEMMHIWQYQKYGAVYIIRALAALQSADAYDYGGIDRLYHGMIKGKELIDFNFEQQAQIVQDAHDLKNKQGKNGGLMELAIYDYYIDQLIPDKNVLTS